LSRSDPASLASVAVAATADAAQLVRADGRDRDVVRFESALVTFFIDAADLMGVPKSVAAIYGICFASPEPLSFTDIEQRLDISKGSVSQGLRVLREIGALQAVSLPGDRREYFAPDLHLRKLAAHWLEQRLQKQIDCGRDRLRQIVKIVPADKNGAAKTRRNRIKTLQGWQDQASSVLPIVKAFLKLT
jgi:DNA-binding transcriptional regulator GbsR (MarR family)